jgi:hypothetical protein
LADALRASLDPTLDRAKAYNPTEGGPRLKKWQEEVRKWRAEQAEKKRLAKEAKEKAAKEKAPPK